MSLSLIILITICTLITVIITAEVQIWGFTLNRHALWVRDNPVDERRVVNWKSLAYNSVLTASLSIITLLIWIWMIVMGGITYPLFFLLWLIGTGFNIILISYLSLIAKLCRLNKYYYPPLTVYIARWFMKWTSN